jgi:hypothetical protein
MVSLPLLHVSIDADFFRTKGGYFETTRGRRNGENEPKLRKRWSCGVVEAAST